MSRKPVVYNQKKWLILLLIHVGLAHSALSILSGDIIDLVVLGLPFLCYFLLILPFLSLPFQFTNICIIIYFWACVKSCLGKILYCVNIWKYYKIPWSIKMSLHVICRSHTSDLEITRRWFRSHFQFVTDILLDIFEFLKCCQLLKRSIHAKHC